MSLHCHARCDWCEAGVVPEPGEPLDEDDLVELGWLVVRFGVLDVRRDFCCLKCLGLWSGSVGAAELVHASMEEGEDAG